MLLLPPHILPMQLKGVRHLRSCEYTTLTLRAAGSIRTLTATGLLLLALGRFPSLLLASALGLTLALLWPLLFLAVVLGLAAFTLLAMVAYGTNLGGLAITGGSDGRSCLPVLQ